ncbi:MAG: ABC transporter ATP-binding protein [Chloroflexi bacterium]|nr:ABC transporter ATP-binding protein [Chloroflexota bacterium]
MSPVPKKGAARRPARAAAPGAVPANAATGETRAGAAAPVRAPALSAPPPRRLEGDHAGAPIRTLGLTKHYDDLVAVDALDLEVRAGEIFGLLGQNGAGKTTTILMLLGLTEPTAGEARVVGLDPTRNPLGVKRRVGYLPDAVGFYGSLTGRENLRYTSRLNGLRGDDAERRIDGVLDQVRLADRADDKVDTYSRGMKQRLGIADALVKEPQVLILDEPTTAIDPIGVAEILELLRELVREQGLAVLLSSHLLNQVQTVCDRVGIFAAGRLIGIGTVPQLARRFGDGGPQIELGLADDPDAEAHRALAGGLAGIAGVRAVHEPADGQALWRLDLESPDVADAALAATLATVEQGGLRLRSIRELEPTLDDIYRRAVSQAGLGGTRRAVA